MCNCLVCNMPRIFEGEESKGLCFLCIAAENQGEAIEGAEFRYFER